MKARSTMRKRRQESGIALLIAIFVLLLISVVAIALIVSSGTESALAGNYRSSTGVYYASLAGLEEARGRLLAKNPDSLLKVANFLPPPGTRWDIGYVRYILNPGPADPLDTLTIYPDTEYSTEFGPATDVKTTQSVWNVAPLNALPIPGPLYKWVRINAVSEQSLNLPVAPLYSPPPYDSTTPVFYDATKPSGAQLNISNPGSGTQVLEITALAVLPNGSQNASQKIVQYLIAPVPLNLNFPAALTLDGTNVPFSVPTSTNFWVKGNDQDSVGSCTQGAPPITAVGYTYDPPDSSRSSILSKITTPNPDRSGQYLSGASTAPNSVGLVSVSPNLQTVAGLNTLVQDISQVADKIINPTPVDATTGLGTATQADLPAAMNSSNPMTVVVNGNLDLNGWHGYGYGLLLVTGEFKYDPDANWRGIVLVIGVGKLSSSKGGTGEFHGAVFLANSVDTTTSPYTPLPPSSAPGPASFWFTPGSGGNGVFYSNCWIQAAMPSLGYRILSFHEISQ